MADVKENIMKRFCKLFALLLALALALTACGGGAGDDGDAANNGQSGDNTATEETTMDLGYHLTLMNVSHYAGAFVEDGSDDVVSDVMVITVRNDGDKTVQYAHITLTVGETAYEFDLTTLPVGASAYLLELSRQTEPESTEGMTADVSAYAVFETEPTLCSDVLEIKTQDTAITITNKSDSDITGQIYVYYKITNGDMYLGGITYRVGTNGLKAGESTTCYAGHFSTDYSKLMFATYVQ